MRRYLILRRLDTANAARTQEMAPVDSGSVPLDTDQTAQIIAILEEHARLGRAPEELGPEDSLYDAGMTSHASVNVMLALEDAFGIEFPDSMLSRRVFESIGSIREAVEDLTAGN